MPQPPVRNETAFAFLRRPRVADLDTLVRLNVSSTEDVDDREGYLWGRPYRRKEGVLTHASISGAVLTFDVKKPATAKLAHQVGKELRPKIDNWFKLVIDWLEVRTTQDLDSRQPLSEFLSRGSTYSTTPWVVCGDEREHYEFVNQTLILVGGATDSTAVTKATWKASIQAANSGIDAPEEHLLIRDARRALRRTRFRTAVLDSATAAEVAFNQSLQLAAENVLGEELASIVLKPLRDITRRLPLAEPLGVSLPVRNFKEELFHLRNSVIHGNRRPEKGEAKVAVDAASEIVGLCSPLPTSPKQ